MVHRKSDVHAGRRLALAIESLGEVLAADARLPEAHRALAESLAAGRSVVPAADHPTDFAARVLAPLPTGIEALSAWLGPALARWLTAAPDALRDAAEVVVEARLMVLESHAPRAEAFRAWYAIGLPDAEQEVFARASALALGEAVDRWVALGCEGDLGRYVSTWQRSASGWAESALGSAVEIPTSELGRLREVQQALREVRREGVRPESIVRALSERLGWPARDVERLVAMESVVRERLDPRVALRRRWSIVQPIAKAVGALERELGVMPSVAQIAERAGVHEATVELCLDAIGD
jgi:hypothetical protein